jgi:hypothetical protein
MEHHIQQQVFRSFASFEDTAVCCVAYSVTVVVVHGTPMDLEHMVNRTEGMTLGCAVDNMVILEMAHMQGSQEDHRMSMATAC